MIAPGAAVHQYELIRELGRGGMGAVVLARDTRLGRRVAIKFLLDATEALARRFLHEARTTAQLRHDNIVVIHEVNEHERVPFMVLEYLDGQPLTQLVRDGGLPWTRALELMVPVVRALARAHEHGIVHRDLKPDNVFVTAEGTVKVLDFGIAKAFAPAAAAPPTGAAPRELRLTEEGAIVGTLPYMSPEQLRAGGVDARTDLWAVGLILFELITGRHPLAPLDADAVFRAAAALDEPMARLRTRASGVPDALDQAVAACLEKRAERRLGSARELLALLEPLLPGRWARPLGDGESPYLGLTAFQESDAARFFGRDRDTLRVIARLREQPLVAIAGPSGVGKSSFVRAGVIPALKASGEPWETFTLRPGRDPMAALAALLDGLDRRSDHDATNRLLRREPGFVGTLLRARARQHRTRILIFIDQFEELYTLVASDDERRAFAECLAGVADDATTPLRIVLSMRADFLDRLGEQPRLAREVALGLIFLAPPEPDGLRDALTLPLEQAGYRFQSPALVDDMLAALQATPGSLPLLQFVAARLWDTRDRTERTITVAAYQAMGGIAGALAAHADEVVAHMPAEARRLAWQVLQRLVTPERTRAIVDTTDLLALSPRAGDVGWVLDRLVHARLLVVQARGETEAPAVELVHESLITAWPRLRRWLDESEDERVFLAQLAAAARQWEVAGRPAGLLWRGESAGEARRFAARELGVLPPRERAFLDAVMHLATRATRIRRVAAVAAFATLVVIAVAAIVATALIRDAQHATQLEAVRARDEAAKARAAEQISADRLREIEQRDQSVARGKEDLADANARLIAAAGDAEAARKAADAARARAEDAAAKLRELLAEKNAELRKLKKANRPF